MLVRQRDTTMMPHLQKLKQVLLSEMIQNLELAMDCPEVDGEEAGSGRFGDIDRVKSLVDESRLMIVLTMTVTRVVSLRLMVLVKMVVGSSV